MSRFQNLFAKSFDDALMPDDWLTTFFGAERDRKILVFRVQKVLHNAALTLGQTTTQADTKIDTLFSTFAAEWAIFVLTGSLSIVTAISDDVTIPWLDTDVAGTTIRQRLINRLS